MTSPQELLDAIQRGEVEKVHDLLARNPSLANARHENGVSALMSARYRMSQPLIDAIVIHRRDLDIFEAAALGRDSEVADLLMRDGGLVNAYAPDGFTALHLACFFGNEESVRHLLAAGGNPNAVAENVTRVTPLHSAAASRRASCVRLILQGGALPDAKQQHGYTALMSAALHGDRTMARVLLDHGAQKEIRCDDGKTAAEFAREKGFADLGNELAV